MRKKTIQPRREPSGDIERAKISNCLLRLNGITGKPPAPFERPNAKMDFFVLELGFHDEASDFCTYTMKALKKHAAFIRKMQAAGASVTLFVEYAASEYGLRFESPFLRCLAEAGISLECCAEAT